MKHISEYLKKYQCELCGGSGTVTLPAYQQGGEVRDEEVIPCECTLTKIETEMEDDRKAWAQSFVAYLKEYQKEKQKDGFVPTIDLLIEDLIEQYELHGEEAEHDIGEIKG